MTDVVQGWSVCVGDRPAEPGELGQASPEWATVRRIADAVDVPLTELAALVEAEA